MDADGDDVPDTRVFVSGLPPKYTSDQLGAHFAGRYQITDAVVLPGRQIGFVGFRNYTLAKNAIKYFDKTYVRMSKISVSMARPVDVGHSDQGLAAPAVGHEAGTQKIQHTDGTRPNATSSLAFTPYVPVTGSPTSNKRKREDGEALQEFMSVMQPSKKPIWDTEDPTAQGIIGDVDQKQERKEKEKKHNQERTEDKENKVPKKKKSSKSAQDESVPGEKESGDRGECSRKEKEKRKQEKLESQMNIPSVQMVDSTEDAEDSEIRGKEAKQKQKKSKDRANAEGGVKPLDEDAFGTDKDETDLVQSNNTKSDNDWLRAKTSRTLDLLGPKDDPKSHAAPNERDTSEEESSDDEKSAPSPQVAEEVAKEVPVSNGRLFIRNLPFTTTEDDLRNTFSRYGKIAEVHVVRDFKTSTSKGLAYLQYVETQYAELALRGLDGKSFQGRLLHILPASDKKSTKLNEFELAKLPLKTQKAMKRKADASTSIFSWNSLYMNPDAVLSSVADRLGIDKAAVLDPTSSDAGVKQALAETDVIQKTRTHLRESGVDVEALKRKERDEQTILLKNFPYGTTREELRTMLDPFGQITRFILPPTGTMAVVQYGEKHAASQALRQLAYKNIKGSVLFLERGPRGLFEVTSEGDKPGQSDKAAGAKSDDPAEDQGQRLAQDDALTSTVFVRNLNFSTTTSRLIEIFKPLAGFLSARVKTRTDPKRPGEILSMGFGFVEFATSSQAQSAIAAMTGYNLDGHVLQVQASHKATDAAEERRREDKARKVGGQQTKVIIKNLPFEASKKDIRALFGAYGQLRTVRVPKKFDNSTRGFAFAEFVTAKEAQNAIEALGNTHLLGRRLVLDFAEGESVDPEAEIQAIERKVGQQTSMVNLNKLTGSGRTRKKFNVDAREDVDP